MKSLVAAMMMLFAPWPGGGWPGDAWPGTAWPEVSGSGFTGTEATLTALYALTNLPAALNPTGTHYYFSCALGGDINIVGAAGATGTIGDPKDNWATAQPLSEVSGNWLTFDAGDSCFTFGAGADIDYSVLEAPFSKKVILRIDSTTPGTLALITQTGAPTIAFMHIHCTADTDDNCGGRVVVQDLNLASFSRAGMIVDNGIDLLALNYRYSAIDGTEDMMRPAGNSSGVCINCDGTSLNDAVISLVDHGSLTMIGTGTLTKSTPLANNSAVVSLSGTTGTQVSATMIGHRLYIPPTSTAAVAGLVRLSPSAGFGSRFAGARLLIHGADASTGQCLRVDESETQTSQLRLYQSTVTSCDRLYTLNSASATQVPAATMRLIHWSILDAGGNQNNGNGGITNFLFFDNAGSTLAGSWSFANNVVNNRTNPASFIRYKRPDATTEASNAVAAFRTDVDADTAGIISAYADTLVTGTANAIEQFTPANYRCIDALGSGGAACVAAVSDAVGGTADGLCDESSAPDSCQAVVESAICDPAKSCGTVSGTNTYTIPLYAPVWAEAIGSTQGDLTALRLSVTQYGGR